MASGDRRLKVRVNAAGARDLKRQLARTAFEIATMNVRRSFTELVELLPRNEAASKVFEHVDAALNAARESLHLDQTERQS